MKKKFLSSNFFYYFLDRPIRSLVILLVCFAFFISLDQAYFADSKTSFNSTDSTRITNLAMKLSSINIGLVLTSANVIQDYRSSQISLHTFNISEKFSEVKSGAVHLYNYIEVQIKIAERIITLIRQK